MDECPPRARCAGAHYSLEAVSAAERAKVEVDGRGGCGRDFSRTAVNRTADHNRVEQGRRFAGRQPADLNGRRNRTHAGRNRGRVTRRQATATVVTIATAALVLRASRTDCRSDARRRNAAEQPRDQHNAPGCPHTSTLCPGTRCVKLSINWRA